MKSLTLAVAPLTFPPARSDCAVFSLARKLVWMPWESANPCTYEDRPAMSWGGGKTSHTALGLPVNAAVPAAPDVLKRMSPMSPAAAVYPPVMSIEGPVTVPDVLERSCAA